MDKNKILILGKIPPPIGGVTIHTSRLLESLQEKNYTRFHFLDLSKTSILKILTSLISFPVTHLHTSHVYFQLLAAVLCFVTRKKLIITYHGNLGRYKSFKNWVVNASCRLCFTPIVQNQASMQSATRLNHGALLLSAFLPAKVSSHLDPAILEILISCKHKYPYVFCTNACNLTFDKTGNETYGILALINQFQAMPQAALIVSDPSGKYIHFTEKQMTLPDNIVFISYPHNFSDLLQHTDAFIRNTTTDGDSISIHEALANRISVFATNSIPRPSGCVLYSDISKIDFVSELQHKKQENQKLSVTERKKSNVAELLMQLYDRCLDP